MKRIILTTFITFAAVAATFAADYSKFYKDLPINIQQAEQPVIKEARINVAEYGAVGDGITDCTKAIQTAIDNLAAKGGGQVFIPEGSWLIAPINLKSGIDLHLSKGAMLVITPDRTKHLVAGATKPKHGVSALGCQNVSITGQGIINGNG
ncbi:MAG: glycoside hydrolase family 28 protein, partial [Prevotella sp.]|nr:glycoside hydrolase family 28 protein [Prevotella sp.]